MPSLLQVATVPAFLQAFLLPYARHFQARGWRVDAMARGVSQVPECRAAFDRVFDVSWSRNPLDPRNFLRAAGQVRQIVRQGDYDIVHVHTPVAAFVTRYAVGRVRKNRRPLLIYTAHGFHFYRGSPPLQYALFLALEKLAARWTDYLVVMNREDSDAVRRYSLVPPERMCYMPGIGVDLQQYTSAVVSPGEIQQMRSALGLTPADTLFVLVAEFIPNKRHADALHALAQLNNPSVHLALAGEGPLMEAIRALVQRLNLTQRVHFLGFRRDIPIVVRAARATLLLSQREGLPRSVMESLSLGVPVIGTDIRGIRDLLAEGGGLLVPVGHIAELAKAMTRLIASPEDAHQMGAQGQAQMAAYDLPHILGLHEALYAQALGTVHR